jgi:hypothetical protein
MADWVQDALPRIDIRIPDGRTPLVFTWDVSSFYGWGVNGMNLALALEDDPRFAPFSGVPFPPEELVVDPLREARLGRMRDRSMALWDALRGLEGPAGRIRAPVLAAIANDFAGVGKAAFDRRLHGDPSVGVAFVEHATLSPQGRALARDFPLLIAGSSWNERVFRANGIVGTTTVLQGIDTSLFHPAPRARSIPPGRFVVFSGGKLELRKGQDLVVAAFRAFRSRHPEALLLSAWHSPWSSLMETACAHPGIAPPRPAPDGTPDVVRWAADNGIPWDAVIAVGATPTSPCRTSSARPTWRCSPTAPRAAPTSWRWSAWPAASPRSCRPTQAIWTCWRWATWRSRCRGKPRGGTTASTRPIGARATWTRSSKRWKPSGATARPPARPANAPRPPWPISIGAARSAC